MSNSLYEEAIADAIALREAAESRAKQTLIESMTPQIKDLVEKKLMEELEEEDQVECGMYEEEKSESDDSASEADVEKIDLESDVLENDEDLTKREYSVKSESFDVIKKLMTKNKIKSVLKDKISALYENVKILKTALALTESKGSNAAQRKRINSIYEKLVLETKNIEFNDIIKSDRKLYETFIQLNKELQTMSRRRRRSEGFLNESLEDLLETSLFLEDDEAGEEADEELDMSALDDLSDDEPAEEGSTDSDEELESMTLRQILDLASEALEDDDSDEEPADEPQEEEDEEADEESDEEDSDDDMEEAYEIDELDELEEADCSEDEDEKKEIDEVDEVHLEIDEGMLRKEIMKMKALREGDAAAMASHFGGGKAGDEMFIDVDDSDLNVHADKLGDAPRPSLKKEAALKNVVRKNRLLESKLKEYAQALKGMKEQLSEMNLFNAKLLYANKLMQNKDLSVKQQRHIVESLDEAGTLNEAKLLFESLSKSLTKSRSGGSLNESSSRRVLGSASKATRSAQPNKTRSVEVDRWATLAGIKK